MARISDRDKEAPAAVDTPANIELLVLDVDGVLTSGEVILDDDGREMKRFHVLDGAGIKYFQRVGRKVAIITGRRCRAVEIRAEELGIDIVVQDAKDKLPAYLEILDKLHLPPEQAAVMGDDLTDLPMMRHCGLAIAPANAVETVRDAADLVTKASGGRGAVREAVEILLKSAGLWEQILARYVE